MDAHAAGESAALPLREASPGGRLCLAVMASFLMAGLPQAAKSPARAAFPGMAKEKMPA